MADSTTEVVEVHTDSEIVVVTDSGLQGPAGLNASLLLLEVECEEVIPSKGWPIAINRATGKGILARADNYVKSFVIGFSKDYCAAGFIVELERYAVELTDWTSMIGSQYLIPGLTYHLALTGGMSELPDWNAVTITKLGKALSNTVLSIEIDDPILL